MTYPKQIRITLRNERVWDAETRTTIDSSVPLGFLQVYEPNKRGWEKKQDTQDRWAYLEYCFGEVIYRDGKVWVNKRKGGYGAPITYEEVIIPDHLQPRVLDNVPLSGFKILNSVSRCSTSNKLWRVLDPRGFELELSTACMEEIMLNTTIEKGLIHGECIWKSGHVLDLV